LDTNILIYLLGDKDERKNISKDKMKNLQTELKSKGKRNAKDSIDQVNLEGAKKETPLDSEALYAMKAMGLGHIKTEEQLDALSKGKPVFQLR
jgi:hypothetical protein